VALFAHHWKSPAFAVLVGSATAFRLHRSALGEHAYDLHALSLSHSVAAMQLEY
jgi:hypothetical protein